MECIPQTEILNTPFLPEVASVGHSVTAREITDIKCADCRSRPQAVPLGEVGLCSGIYNASITIEDPEVQLECCLLCPK